MSDHAQVKKLNLNEEMAEIGSNRAEDSVYYASSRMLNDNEMLVTLQLNANSTGCSEGKRISVMSKADNQKDEVTDEDTFEIEYKKHTCVEGTEIAVPHNFQMLNDNEMLVTLQLDANSTGCSEGKRISVMNKADNQKDEVTDEDTFEIEYKKHTHVEGTEIAVPHNFTTDSSMKILTVLSSNIVEASDHSVIVDNLYSDVSETDNGVKTLTILNPVQPHNSDSLELIGISESLAFNHPISEQADENFIIEQEVNECGENSGGTDFSKENASTAEQQCEFPVPQSTQKLINGSEQKPSKKVKKKNIKSKPAGKTSKSVSIDLEKITVPLNEKLKRNPVVQTYTHKKQNKDGKTKFNPGQKLYQKIPLASEEEEVVKVPEQISVYDFYDEEEEKCKAEKAKRDKELQALKERTCMYCKKEFSDPMDVLRHKREFHKTRKVLVSRKELEPYLKLENRTHCPLCYKEVCPLGYKSVYIKHLMVHCQDPNFTCRVCGIKFKRKDHLQSHENRHVMKPENVD